MNPYQVPASEASVPERVSFLRQVGLLTFGGLFVSGITALVMGVLVLSVPLLQHHWVSLGIMLGAIFASQGIGGSLVASQDRSTQMMGFALGTGLQGVAMSYLLITAMVLSIELYDNPLMFLGQAAGLVGLTVCGMVAYLLTGPKNLSMVGGVLATLSLPLLALMVISWIFPIGGTFGILISAGFVVLSAGGLLYNLNQVMHQMSTRDTVPAAYHVTLGVLTLFWNVLVLLMRLQDRR